MELNIKDKKEKPLLSRTEILADLAFDTAITKKEIIKEKIAAKLKSDPNLIVIKKVHNIFGNKKVEVLAFIYKNEKDMKRIEPKPKEKKGTKKEAPEEVAQETPKESPKQEAKEKPKEDNK